MQLMCDAVSVLGSRHGILMDPVNKECKLLRYSRFEDMSRFEIRAGIRYWDKEFVLPLTSAGTQFFFVDQRTSPCTMAIMGIDPASCLKLKLQIVTPFRPRDPDFSTSPVLGLRLEISRLPGCFRWMGCPEKDSINEVEIFFEIRGEHFDVFQSGEDSVDVKSRFMCRFGKNDPRKTSDDMDGALVGCHDRLVVKDGQVHGHRFVKRVNLSDVSEDRMDIAWSTWQAPALCIGSDLHSFRYTRMFSDLDSVAEWARNNLEKIFDNAKKVDGIIGRNNCSASTNSLMAYTLHSWLMDTWWVDRDGKDWFSVWEGNCYLHSTVDVEFTQAPFYLSVWPELLELELGEWPAFSKSGEALLGERGKGTLFLSHDIGVACSVTGQHYTHEMEVEETANYILLAYCHWRRTGRAAAIRANAEIIGKYLRFLKACDTTGNGVPDRGVANTIDDASPAVQYGKEQVYLAVKCIGAYTCGAEIMQFLGKTAESKRYLALAKKIRVLVEKKGWIKDHFATLLEKSGKGLINPWSGKPCEFKTVPGWDSPHIYTENTFACLDMVGCDLGFDRAKVVKDLQTATERCLREYGCVHSDFKNTNLARQPGSEALAGVSPNPGWIAMNMLRDMAAFYRGLDFRGMTDRYWNWQVLTNTQEPKMFFETFNGNNLCFYPRGVAIWGYFDALAGLVIDKVRKQDKTRKPIPQIRVPRLLDANWKKGTCRIIER